MSASDTAGSITVEALAARVGDVVGVSDWLTVDQATIDAFADVSGDHQWIHVDPKRATDTPFGGTIAHGFLVLSLLSRFRAEALPPFAGVAMGINYGLDRVRFTAPVKVGARLRGQFKLATVDQPDTVTWQFTWNATIEIEGADRPALVATWLTRAAVADAGKRA